MGTLASAVDDNLDNLNLCTRLDSPNYDVYLVDARKWPWTGSLISVPIWC